MTDIHQRIEEVTREGDPDELLTAEQVADMLKLTVRRVQDMGRGRGEVTLPRVRLGPHTVRFRLSDVRRLIREATEGTMDGWR